MGLFSRLEPKPVAPPPRVCQHKWTDVRDDDGNEMWYMVQYIEQETGETCGYKLDYTIKEPYVCIHCKERKDVSLESKTIVYKSEDDLSEGLATIRQKYPQIKDRAIVEDAVNDMQLIDRNYLRIAAQVMGVKF